MLLFIISTSWVFLVKHIFGKSLQTKSQFLKYNRAMAVFLCVDFELCFVTTK